jgi:two-component system, OmpR family, KDP operon response regulator KdpE
MSPEHFRVLVAAEDLLLRRKLLDTLISTGFSIEELPAGRAVTEVVVQRRFDLVVLDPGVPETHGIEICSSVRALLPELGIVMIRAGGSPDDEMRALDAGADDCIIAPFKFREIVARLGAVLRRIRSDNPPKDPVLRAGDLQIDTERRQCWRAGQEVRLSPSEFNLLLTLMSNREGSLTHLKLLRALGANTGAKRNTGYIRSYIKSLRGKIESDPSNPEYILTVPWVGYRFHNPYGSL